MHQGLTNCVFDPAFRARRKAGSTGCGRTPRWSAPGNVRKANICLGRHPYHLRAGRGDSGGIPGHVLPPGLQESTATMRPFLCHHHRPLTQPWPVPTGGGALLDTGSSHRSLRAWQAWSPNSGQRPRPLLPRLGTDIDWGWPRAKEGWVIPKQAGIDFLLEQPGSPLPSRVWQQKARADKGKAVVRGVGEDWLRPAGASKGTILRCP